MLTPPANTQQSHVAPCSPCVQCALSYVYGRYNGGVGTGGLITLPGALCPSLQNTEHKSSRPHHSRCLLPRRPCQLTDRRTESTPSPRSSQTKWKIHNPIQRPVSSLYCQGSSALVQKTTLCRSGPERLRLLSADSNFALLHLSVKGNTFHSP